MMISLVLMAILSLFAFVILRKVFKLRLWVIFLIFVGVVLLFFWL